MQLDYLKCDLLVHIQHEKWRIELSSQLKNEQEVESLLEQCKNAEFKVGKNGLWTITSSEEIEAYNPSKLQITEFKFDKTKYKYEVDTTYVYIDIENEKMMNDLKKPNR